MVNVHVGLHISQGKKRSYRLFTDSATTAQRLQVTIQVLQSSPGTTWKEVQKIFLGVMWKANKCNIILSCMYSDVKILDAIQSPLQTMVLLSLIQSAQGQRQDLSRNCFLHISGLLTLCT